MVLVALLTIAVGHGVANDVQAQRYNRTAVFLQAVRDNMVDGHVAQFDDLVSALIEIQGDRTQYRLEKPVSRRFHVNVISHPSGKVWVRSARFEGHRVLSNQARDPARAFNPNRLPAVMTNLARAAGFVGEVRIDSVTAPSPRATRVTASLYWKGLLVLPPERFRADFDYETGGLYTLSFSRMIALPDEEPQVSVDRERVADRLVQEALQRPGITRIDKVFVELVVDYPLVFEPSSPPDAWFHPRFRLASEGQVGVYGLSVNALWGGGVYSACYDPTTGDQLRWHDDRSSPGGPGSPRAPRPSVSGERPMRFLSGSRLKKVTGSLEPAEKPVEFVGKPLVLRRETAAWRIEYDGKSGLVKLGEEFFKPSKAVKVALDKITR